MKHKQIDDTEKDRLLEHSKRIGIDEKIKQNDILVNIYNEINFCNEKYSTLYTI